MGIVNRASGELLELPVDQGFSMRKRDIDRKAFSAGVERGLTRVKIPDDDHPSVFRGYKRDYVDGYKLGRKLKKRNKRACFGRSTGHARRSNL